MHDVRIEDLLRQTLREEAGSLPFTVSADLLERRLIERRRQIHGRRWLAAAAAVAFAITGGVVILSQFQSDFPPIAATPSPPSSPSGPTPLPDPAALLTDLPPTTLLLQASVGPADRIVDPVASPDPSPLPVEAGRVTIDGPFVLATVCRGPGLLTVTLGDGSPLPVIQSIGPCDGEPHHTEYLSRVPLSGPDGFVVTVTASAAASWRLVIGAYTSDLGVEPVFPSITPTAGWNQLVDIGMVLMSPTSGTGAAFEAPGEATRVGVLVQCQGDGSVSFFAGPAPAASAPPGPSAAPIDQIDCMATPSSHRFETVVTGGERVSIRATSDAFVWIRLVVETDADLATTYPIAPTLPAAVAETPYSETVLSMLGIGTVGGNHQTVLPVRQARPGVTTGEVMPVNIYDETTGASRLELLTIPDGERVVTVATVAAPGLILASWADAAHRQVFYVMTPDQRVGALRYHRVGFDGSGDRVIAEAPTGGDLYLFGGTNADLALDGSAFVIDICDAGACRFTIIDATNGAARDAARSKEPICSILGVAGGNVVATTQDTCSVFDGNVKIVALPLDGGAGRALVDGIVLGQLIDTPTGARLVHTRYVDVETSQTIETMDIETRETTVLLTRGAGDPFVVPRPLRLPEGWVLLATMSLGDFPQAAIGPRAVPILIDLVSGKQYEMVNLPH